MKLLTKDYLPVGSVLTTTNYTGVITKSGPSDDYSDGMAMIYLLAGVILPLVIPHPNAWILYIYIPWGIFKWASKIFRYKKHLYKYEITIKEL